MDSRLTGEDAAGSKPPCAFHKNNIIVGSNRNALLEFSSQYDLDVFL
jgi:hypothetical protein